MKLGFGVVVAFVFALVLAAARCGREVPLGVAPVPDAASSDAGDAGAAD